MTDPARQPRDFFREAFDTLVADEDLHARPIGLHLEHLAENWPGAIRTLVELKAATTMDDERLIAFALTIGIIAQQLHHAAGEMDRAHA